MVKPRMSDFLPEFPKTMHLPWDPNPGHGDAVATLRDVEILRDPHVKVYIEEKIDGSSVGITFDEEGHPVIRNKDHILQKGYMRKKDDTTAKKQFRPLWNWVYEHMDQFAGLKGYSLYGQWMLAQHGMYYDSLPDWLITHDLFSHDEKKWVEPSRARALLESCGFVVAPNRSLGPQETTADYVALANLPSSFTTVDRAEGIYLKIAKGDWIVSRFKMVRQDFVQGKLWDDKVLSKNRLKEKIHGCNNTGPQDGTTSAAGHSQD